jgi:transcriptional regulator with XRE-family HTH domain
MKSKTESIDEKTAELAEALRKNMTFANYFKMARLSKKMSRLELAAKASVSESTLHAIEQGSRTPAAATLGKVVKALELNIDPRAYLLSLWAEERIKAGDQPACKKNAEQPYQRAALTPMTEEERAALERIIGVKLPQGI